MPNIGGHVTKTLFISFYFKYFATNSANTQSSWLSISNDSKRGVSKSIGFLPILAFDVLKLSLVKIYKLEFSSYHGSKSCVLIKLFGSWFIGSQSLL